MWFRRELRAGAYIEGSTIPEGREPVISTAQGIYVP
jgi:hypothetical protein